MEPAILGIVLDSSVLIAAERAGLTAPEAIKRIRASVGEVPIAICSLTVAELANGIYRAASPQRGRLRRQFLDELTAHVPVLAVTGATAEIIARIGAEQAARGINLPLADLVIGATAVELGYAVATRNSRDFDRVPGLHTVHL